MYEYDCFMYVHMCTYCICMYFMYSVVRISLVSNCAIYIIIIVVVVVIIRIMKYCYYY